MAFTFATLNFLVSACFMSLLGEGQARHIVANAAFDEGVAHVVSPNVGTAINKAVLDMSEGAFREAVLDPVGEAQRVKDWVVVFHSRADAQSRVLMPSFENMLARLLGRSAEYENIGFAKVDCGAQGDLCAALDVTTKFPSVFHYQERQVVGAWTSGGVTGLVPWLQKELLLKTSKGGEQSSLTLGLESIAEARQIAWQALQSSSAARRSLFATSHLEVVHDLIFMEDCEFSRLLSFLLLVAILLKTAGIVLIEGAELRLSTSTFARLRFWRSKTAAAGAC